VWFPPGISSRSTTLRNDSAPKGSKEIKQSLWLANRAKPLPGLNEAGYIKANADGTDTRSGLTAFSPHKSCGLFHVCSWFEKVERAVPCTLGSNIPCATTNPNQRARDCAFHPGPIIRNSLVCLRLLIGLFAHGRNNDYEIPILQMSPLSRILVCSGLAFALGLAIGRSRLHPSVPPAIQTETAPQSKPPIQIVDDAPKNTPVTKPVPLSEAATNDRLRALSSAATWFRGNGFGYMDVQVFDYNKGGISPAFASLFGLSSSEQKTLDAAINEARRRSIEMRTQAAKVTEDPNSDLLIIDIPTQPELGGKIYDKLLGTFRNVLGPDRYAYFNDFSGRPFERGLDFFGASKTKFEITKTVSPDGKLYYAYKKYYNEPTTAAGGGSTSGTVDLNNLAMSFPELVPLLPPRFRAKPAR